MATSTPDYPIEAALEIQSVKGKRIEQRLGFEDYLRRFLFILVGLGFYLFLIYPLFRGLVRSFQAKTGEFVGLTNYINYFSSATTSTSLTNSLYVSAMSTIFTVVLAFLYAYGLSRMTIPGRRILRMIALLPIFIPSLVQALALIYIFGNNGVFTRLVGLNIHLYGSTGIILSEAFYAFPHAFIIIAASLALADARLYEAAESLRTKGSRIFTTVTLSSAKYGLMSAAFVVFTLAITDFGAPKVVGGNFDVLATDIYNKVVGQQNFEMGATISTLLLIPALIAFVLDRIVQRRQVAAVSVGITPMTPRPHNPAAQWGVYAFMLLMAGFILSIYGVVLVGAFTRYWPYDLSLTLKNFTFYVAGTQHRGGAFVVLWTSIKMAFWTALAGTTIVFFSAYLIEKTRGISTTRSVLYLLSIMPLAIPGMVLGLSYIFTFNNPASPLNFLYGTLAILVISSIVHYYSVPFLTATTALKQLDPEFEAIGESLNAPFYRTFWRVTVPVTLPAIISIASYFFLNAMVTLSAVVFLFVPGKELASLSVMLLDDAGETAQAMAMALLIILVGFLVRGLFFLLTHGVERRTQAWTKR
ncbi:MAG: putative 2-aminoethylphosphonate ABC transporter permease subunit [Anaerolineales bacterium]|jgi:iron(III) transport system permease protein